MEPMPRAPCLNLKTIRRSIIRAQNIILSVLPDTDGIALRG